MDLDDIKYHTLKAINSSIDISKDEISTFDRKISSNRDEEYLQIIIKDASYGLKNRRKGDKLSHDQIKFFKVLSKDSSISTNEIWKAYNVSLSVLRKIMWTTDEEINKTRIKKFV